MTRIAENIHRIPTRQTTPMLRGDGSRFSTAREWAMRSFASPAGRSESRITDEEIGRPATEVQQREPRAAMSADFEGEDPGDQFPLLDMEEGDSNLLKRKARSLDGPLPEKRLKKSEPPKKPDPLAVQIAAVRNASTPVAMADRVPPRVDTAVQVTLSRQTTKTNPVALSVIGSGGGNGTATINGAGPLNLTASGTIQVRGGVQTTAGNAGALRLQAQHLGANAGQSAAFSVAAIPQNFSVSFKALATGAKRGIKVNNSWQSDSGATGDLDQVSRSEQVQYSARAGIFANVVAHNSGFRAANNPPIVDNHRITTTALTAPGGITADQVFIFNDARTGAVNIPVTNSGFQVSRNVANKPQNGGLEITTRKRGANVTANGHTSAAAQGDVSRTQDV